MTDLTVAPPVPAAPPATDNVRPEIIAGVTALILFFGVFIGWAALAPLDAGAYAPGQVVVTGNRQAVQHRDGGIVETVSVAEGDRVRRGQVLVTLAVGELVAEERGLAGEIFALLAQRARLVAERDNLPDVPAPAEFAALSADDREIAKDALSLQRQQFAARGAGRSTETGVLGQRVGQLRRQIEGLARQIDSNERQQALIAEELGGVRALAAKGYAPQTRLRELERVEAGLQGEAGSLRAQVARTEEQIGEARLQMSGVSTTMKEEVADQLRQIEVQLNERRPRWRALRDRILRSRIVSPAAGQVLGLTIFTEGGVIQPAQVLMEIVPEQSAQLIVVRVDPVDVDNVRLGQETEVKFPGLREANPPTVKGHLTRISPDAIFDSQTGVRHFRGEIAVHHSELGKLGPLGEHIRAGTPVQAVIVTRKRTALSYLTEPLTLSLWRFGTGQ